MGLFSGSREITISDKKNRTEITISKDSIKQLYSGLDLKSGILKKGGALDV